MPPPPATPPTNGDKWAFSRPLGSYWNRLHSEICASGIHLNEGSVASLGPAARMHCWVSEWKSVQLERAVSVTLNLCFCYITRVGVSMCKRCGIPLYLFLFSCRPRWWQCVFYLLNREIIQDRTNPEQDGSTKRFPEKTEKYIRHVVNIFIPHSVVYGDCVAHSMMRILIFFWNQMLLLKTISQWLLTPKVRLENVG